MGIGMASYEIQLPRVLLHVAIFFGYVRWIITWLLNVAGLGDLLDSSSSSLASLSESNTGIHDLRHTQPHHNYHRYERFQSASLAKLIEEELPVARYEEMAAVEHHVGGSCSVCLLEYEAGDEIRRLSNCRHVHHRGCLDRWMEHGHRSCPLCRAPLFSREAKHGSCDMQNLWELESGTDVSYYDDLVEASFSFFSSSSSSSSFFASESNSSL